MSQTDYDREALAKLLRQYKKLVGENSYFAAALHDQAGKNLHGNLFEEHADLLAPVLKNGNDLQDLFAFMRDCRASYDVTGQMLPDTVLGLFVAAKSDSGKICVELGISSSRLHKRLSEHPRTLLRFLSLPDPSVHDAVRANIDALDKVICSKRDAQALVSLLAVTANNSLVKAANLLGSLEKAAEITGLKATAEVFNLVRVLITEHNPLLDSEIWLPVLSDVCEALGTDDFLKIARFMQCGSLVKALTNTVGCQNALRDFWNKAKDIVDADPHLPAKIAATLSHACFPEMTRDNFTLLCREIIRILESGGSLETLQLPYILPPPVFMVDADIAPPESEAILVRQLPAFPAFPQNVCLRHVEVEWQGIKATFDHAGLAKIFEKHKLLDSGEPSYVIIEAVFEAAKKHCQNAPEIVARILATETLGIKRTELVRCLSYLEYSRQSHDGPPPYPEHDE